MGQSVRIHYHYGGVLARRGKKASDQQYSGAWNHPAYHGGAVNLLTAYWYRRKDSVFMESVKAVDSGGSLLGGNVFSAVFAGVALFLKDTGICGQRIDLSSYFIWRRRCLSGGGKRYVCQYGNDRI